MKDKFKKLLIEKTAKQAPEAGDEGVPRITSDTVATHRDEVLASARKYIYPLQHSKHRIVLISTALFITFLVSFFTYTVLALYKFQNTSKFVYRVTQVVPFPVARSGSTFVAYENYLFELRHYMHYYTTQQKLDFKSESGQQQLADYKKKALDKVVNDALVKQLAKKHGVSVSGEEVDAAITVLRNQNRLGGSDKVFEDVLREFWDWSTNDFKRSLKQTLLSQKVVSALDSGAHDRAKAALDQLKSGADFTALAKQVSEDQETKEGGGDFGFLIGKTSTEVPYQLVEALFRLKAGEHSEIIDVGYGLEIVKVLEVNGEKVRAAHIRFNFQDLNIYLNELKDQQKVRLYLKI